MNKPLFPAWFNQTLSAAEEARLHHIDLLIDSSNLQYPLQTELTQEHGALEIALLLQDTPEEAIASIGPWLVRLPLKTLEQQPWLKPLLSSPNANHHLLALLSPWRFADLTHHLRHCTQVQWNNGKSTGLLRFYDPRLITAVTEALDPNQRWFHAPIISWHWCDRDQQPRSLPGYLSRQGLPSPLPTLVLKNLQIAGLIAWAEAEDYRRSWDVQPQHYGLSQQEALMRHLMHAQLDANRADLHDPDQRDAFVRNWLAEHSPISPPEEAEAQAEVVI
ncbi:DUF4123 domain-containing protein [Pseudomonas sp. 5P_3.1_Bac2]|uniref:DUF4123 domain-containing protein n=1 Tax=Pseudomonas sp. 5P_3.1_Bac2 TaxID=2971617 RepID=UPI0021CA24A1|nr:DUF4123 domain-containing protein [Pseudomonas sp. 5P_3.1_Bac2]MCU1718987.1 DUF4123 domain-containing protein [Pseudomonas sp. 5P_3.1_Bac2]